MKQGILISISVFIAVLSAILCSCKYIADDPFADGQQASDTVMTGAETLETEPETENITESENENEPAKDHPDDTFYGMTTSQAYEKYGLFSLSPWHNYDNIFDGTNIYYIYFTDNRDANSSTLGKFEWPHGGKGMPACTDPLCSHRSGGCPFAGYNGSNVCYDGKIYFTTDSGTLKVYDKTTNRSTTLLSRCYNYVFCKYDGNLYFIYNKEDNDFNTTRVFTKILPDKKIIELGYLDEFYNVENAVYKDRYAVDYQVELNDGGGNVNVIFHDLLTKEIKKITEINCPGAVAVDAAYTYTLYGDKLLMHTRYLTSFPSANPKDTREEVWLIDLSTNEKRLICSPDYLTYKTTFAGLCFSFSSKCVMWCEPRFKESEPFIIHMLFPYTGEEKVYNVSDIVYKETGDSLKADDYIASMANSALQVRRIINDKARNIYEIDLENGNVYKYDQSLLE